MSSPTPEQIQKVKDNLQRMQAFNDRMYESGLANFMNAFALLTESKGPDLGLTVALNIAEGGFWAAGAVTGPAGSFVASFLSGMMVYWASEPPSSISGEFAEQVSRFKAMNLEVDATLATYSADVAGNWDTSFTYNGDTQALSALATFDFPAETDVAFAPLLQAAVAGLDRSLWTELLTAKMVVTQWVLPDTEGTWKGQMLMTEYPSPNMPPADWADEFYEKNPAYYEPWTWYGGDAKNCCGRPPCWAVAEFNLGTGVSATGLADGSLSKDACNYLFIDGTPGTIINPEGLFTREDVFTTLQIPTATYYVTDPTGGMTLAARSPDVSLGFMRAMKDQQTLGHLFQREGREQIERRIVRRAQEDAVFRHDLQMRPRKTLEEFLGVRIPDVVSLHVVVEQPWSLGIVIPRENWGALHAAAGGVSTVPTDIVKQGIAGLFAAVPQAADAELARTTTAVYHVALTGPAGGDWTVRVGNGAVAAEAGAPERADVTLRATALDWLEIASGRMEGGLAFFLGRLTIEGDPRMARRLRAVVPAASLRM